MVETRRDQGRRDQLGKLMTYPPEYPADGICGCCELWFAKDAFCYTYGCCAACASCQSIGHCFEGEDKPENTICCHGTRDDLCLGSDDRKRMARRPT